MEELNRSKFLFQGGILLINFILPLCLSSGEINSTTAEPSTNRPPIELQDIGYYGTWMQFCDRKKTDEDFAFYPHHELKTLRLLICERKDQNKINSKTMGPFAAYKYCEIKRSCADDFLDKLITLFSMGDDKKQAELLAPGPVVDETTCFRAAENAFNDTCVDKMNPFFRMFTPLLARACTSQWLSEDNILSYIEQVCIGKRLSADIEWNAILASINIRE